MACLKVALIFFYPISLNHEIYGPKHLSRLAHFQGSTHLILPSSKPAILDILQSFQSRIQVDKPELVDQGSLMYFFFDCHFVHG